MLLTCWLIQRNMIIQRYLLYFVSMWSSFHIIFLFVTKKYIVSPKQPHLFFNTFFKICAANWIKKGNSLQIAKFSFKKLVSFCFNVFANFSLVLLITKKTAHILTRKNSTVTKLWWIYGAKYSKMDQVKFVEDSLLKIWSDTVFEYFVPYGDQAVKLLLWLSEITVLSISF